MLVEDSLRFFLLRLVSVLKCGVFLSLAESQTLQATSSKYACS